MKPARLLCIVSALSGIFFGCDDRKGPSTGETAPTGREEKVLVKDVQPTGEPILDWLICGEFASVPQEGAAGKESPGKEQSRGSGLRTDYLSKHGGEAKIRPAEGSPCAGGDPRRKWFRYVSNNPYHLVGLGKTWAAAGRARAAKKNVVAYAYTSFSVEGEQPAYLMMGSSDGMRVWLNGRLVHETSRVRDLVKDQDAIQVTLQPGINRLLAKVERKTKFWQLALRVANERQAFPRPEDGDLFLKHGKKKYSSNREDVIIRHFFKERRGGFFLDVGAGHHRDESNTFYLEKHLGWSGIAVDALDEFRAGYVKWRPRTKFFAYVVGDRDGGETSFYRSKEYWVLSSTSREKVKEFGRYEERKVPRITLNTLLARNKIEKLDFLNMDIELGEPAALAGFDIDRFKPKLVCIEAHRPVRKQIVDYFKKHRYERVEKYLPFDRLNWYYRPKE